MSQTAEQESTDLPFESRQEIDPLTKCYLFDKEAKKFYVHSIKIELGQYKKVIMLRNEGEEQKAEQKLFDLRRI